MFDLEDKICFGDTNGSTTAASTDQNVPQSDLHIMEILLDN
jgi:hypothetical protein